MSNTPSASYSLTLRVKVASRVGTLGELTTAIGRAGGDIGAIDIVSVTNDAIVRDVTLNAASDKHGAQIVEAIRDIDGVEVINVSDRTFLMHLGGKIEVVSKTPLKTRARVEAQPQPRRERAVTESHRLSARCGGKAAGPKPGSVPAHSRCTIRLLQPAKNPPARYDNLD